MMYSTDMPKKVSFTQARAELSDLLDDVGRTHEHVEITRNGRPAAVLMSPEEYEVIQETLEILGDAETLDALRESEADVRARRLQTLAEVRRELGLA
jgi:antitoxin YefM